MNLPRVRIVFHEPDYMPEEGITYSVIGCRYRGRWVFVRHRGKHTWEMPAGHVEEGETPEEAACRELAEETGAVLFDLHCVATYSVEEQGVTGYGRLYFAEIKKMENFSDREEIEEVVFSDDMPSALTYPVIQPVLFGQVVRYTQKLSS